MSDQFDENAELIQGFIEESFELLNSAENDVFVLEENPGDQGRLNQVFRTFHTIKGNAGFLEFQTISRFAHLCENLFSKLREGELQISKGICDLLFQILDRLKLMLEAPEKSETIETADLENFIKKLQVSEVETVTKKVRFLVVEDESVQQEILKLMLEDYGENDIAGNGKEAVDKFQESLEKGIPYSIIFMDIWMPEMNGIEAVTCIREIENERGISLLDEVPIVMTTHEKKTDIIFKTFYKAGATTYLNKPVSSSRLNDIIKTRLTALGN